VSERSEQAVTNAIQRVMRAEARHLRFLTGHGERSPKGRGREALSRFVRAVEDTGMAVSTLNLAQTPEIPDDTAALVLADPTRPLLDAEVAAIRKYVDSGGHLLWLTDGGPHPSLRPLADELGLSFFDGRVMDPRSRAFGLQEPTRVLVANYPRHPITRDFRSITLFPGATGMAAEPPEPWQSTALLKTGRRAWVETGEAGGATRFNAEDGDRKGPVTLGVALKRPRADKGDKGGEQAAQARNGAAGGPAKPGQNDQSPGQRLVVASDSDFLSNAFVGSGANRALGLNLVHWLTADRAFINIQPAKAPGTSLQLPTAAAWGLPVLFLIAIPLLLVATGTAVWLRRRRL
jgi:ABC-type uncharacterized transport system involved in gliding motility auxiliary subunit